VIFWLHMTEAALYLVAAVILFRMARELESLSRDLDTIARKFQ